MPQKDTQKRREYNAKYYLEHSERVKSKRQENAEHFKEIGKVWEQHHPFRKREWDRRNRVKVLEHYGMACACCGESHVEFLTIDHIGGNGSIHRKEIRRSTIYSWLIQNNFPDGFQILCWNCNCSKGIYGVCPHTK